MSVTRRRAPLNPAASGTITGSTLRDAAIAPSTHYKYNRSLDKFLHYTRLSLSALLRRPARVIDVLFSNYLEYEFHHHGSYHNSCHALNGLIFRCPRLRMKLGETRLRLRGWRRLYKHKSHPPFTWEITLLFASVMAKWGHHAEAVGMLLSFHCYLRVGELTRLVYSDVLMPNDPRAGSAHTDMALRLQFTKTGAEQSVSIESRLIARVLRGYLAAFPFLSDSHIFPFSPSSFRHLISQVASSLGMGDIPYVPHSLRHGGATYDFLRVRSIEQIMFRGRWVSMESARRYVQTCKALLIRQQVPQHLHDLGTQLGSGIEEVLTLLRESVEVETRAAPSARRT
jgi:integrase